MTQIQNTENNKSWQRCTYSRDSPTLTAEMQNGTATSEDSVVDSYKAIHAVTVQSSSWAPWYHLLKGVENIHPHKNWHMNISSSFIHICQNVEATKMVFSSEWRNQLCCIQTVKYYSMLKYMICHEKTWGILNVHCYLEEASPESYILYYPNYMIFCKRKNTEAILFRGCQGLGGGEILIDRAELV